LTCVRGTCRNCGGGIGGGKKAIKRVSGFVGSLARASVVSRSRAVVIESGTGITSNGTTTGGRGFGCLSTKIVEHPTAEIRADSGPPFTLLRRVFITTLLILTIF